MSTPTLLDSLIDSSQVARVEVDNAADVLLPSSDIIAQFAGKAVTVRSLTLVLIQTTMLTVF